MACFVVPAVEAVVTAAAAKIVKNNEKEALPVSEGENTGKSFKIPFVKKASLAYQSPFRRLCPAFV